MQERQYDLFAQDERRTEPGPPAETGKIELVAAAFSDQALISAIPQSTIAQAQTLAAEAARRGLQAAVPALERLCRRLAGFGGHRPVLEQVAALEALARIGGKGAADAVQRILARNEVQGPGLAVAMSAAVRLGIVLPENAVLPLLRHAEPQVRADACRCAPFRPAVVAVLIDLLGDLHDGVAIAAACALGRMGRTEGRPMLLRRLRQAPATEVIDAVVEIADDETVVLLGRIARSTEPLADLALSALADIDHPRAVALASKLMAVR